MFVNINFIFIQIFENLKLKKLLALPISLSSGKSNKEEQKTYKHSTKLQNSSRKR
jgi:hypothetical protein